MSRTSEGAVARRAARANSEPVRVSHKDMKAAVDAAMKRRGLDMDLSVFRRRKR